MRETSSENINNIKKIEKNTENGRHCAKLQMQKNWKSKQYNPKSKIANEGGPLQA